MMKQTYKRCLLIMTLIGLCLILVLHARSDHRPQTVKEVAYGFKIHLSKDVKRLEKMYREPDFHENGEAGILLSAKAEEVKFIESRLSPYEMDKSSEEFAALEGYLTALNRRGFLPDLGEISRAYFKQTTDYRYGNFIGLLINERTNRISYVHWGSWC